MNVLEVKSGRVNVYEETNQKQVLQLTIHAGFKHTESCEDLQVIYPTGKYLDFKVRY